MRMIFLAIFSSILFCSCVSSVNVLKPNGETVSLEIANSLVGYQGELLAVNDTMLFFEYNAELFEIPLYRVSKMHIQGYSLKETKTFVMAPLVLVDVLVLVLIAPSASEEEEKIVLSLGSLMPLTVISFLTGDPKVNFLFPFEENDLESLTLYCRYPQGLTQKQWKQLLQHYGQKDFQMLSQQ